MFVIHTYKQTSFAPLLKAFNAQDEQTFHFSEVQLYGLKLIEYNPRYRAVDRMHSHGLWEIHLFKSGHQIYQFKDEEVKVSSGEMILILPGAQHCQTRSGDGYCKFSLTLRLGRHIDRLCVARKNVASYYVLPAPAGIQGILEYLFENVNISEKSSLLELRCCMELLLVRLVRTLESLFDCEDGQDRSTETVHFGGSQADFCERVLQFIRGNITRTLSVQEIAAEFAISSRQLCRKLQAYYGKTPGSIITELRCNFAKELLESSDFSVAEIADQIGFTDVSHFIRFFKRKEGQTPANYRKNYNKANYRRVY